MENRKDEDSEVHEMQKNCPFCYEKDPLINYKTSYKTLERKYFEAFNFYFAKPVNEILANVSSAHVILFKDYLFYDDESNEYLQRYYKSEEIKPRVKALTEFYSNSYKPTRPNLCIIESNKIINKRNQKMNKLLNRNAKEQKPEHVNNIGNNEVNHMKYDEENIENDNLILENILTSNFEKEEANESQLPMCYKYQEEAKENNEILPFLEPREEKSKISYDSSEHDIYNPDFSQVDVIKDFEQLMKPSKANENKPFSLNKIKTRTTFKQKEPPLPMPTSTNKQNYELLLEEIINKQKQNVGENFGADVFMNSFKMNNNILKDFSENRISDISELLNLHEMIRNSQKISNQSSAQKQKELNNNKIEVPHIKKKENVSSQLTQDSTKRTTGNTTTASQNAFKNPEKFNKKIQISHNTLFSQINKFYNKAGNVDQIFELIKKMQRDEDKTPILPVETKSVKPANRNCSTKSNKDLLNNGNAPRFFGSQTDRVPDKTHEQLFLKPKHVVNKLNLNLLNEKKPKEKSVKQRSPSTSRHSNKKVVETNNNTRKHTTKKVIDNLRNKPTKISFRSLNSNIYSSLRNRSNISSKSHLDTQRSSDVLVLKSQDHLVPKTNNVILGAQQKSQLENLEENESSYGFWTSRSNKVNIEEIKRRNQSPEIGKKLEGGKVMNFNLDREDYYNYGLKDKDGGKMKAKTDRFEKDNEINQFIKLAYENPQMIKLKSSEMGKPKKKSEKGQAVKRNFKLNLPVNVKL